MVRFGYESNLHLLDTVYFIDRLHFEHDLFHHIFRSRIQRIVVSELTKIAIVHLYAQGYENADLVNFELGLTGPSIIYEQEKVALMKEKVDLASTLVEKKLFSMKYIYSATEWSLTPFYFSLTCIKYTNYSGIILYSGIMITLW
jgi:hypothetical protein